MNVNNNIIKFINENLSKNSEFEFIARLGELTLLDMYYIEKQSTIKNIKSKLTYQIIDNSYIKIQYFL
ncbi:MULTISPECIES: hypothetical protein [unclassified Clostridium]|uniref:hypothetical protein n=1 Tax=unclassified Clostridium TaxID=2614128 RepID=UPI00029778D1|nr:MULTISPECIES: hypothetical protein [unclassified Clostridium]EKQ58225.1 MAG: hypothetical protein A370_00081 [Clostridium sp. Maddingley MBC34-26]